MLETLPPVALVLLALLMGGVWPRLMAQQTQFRFSPRAALLAWQGVALGAIISALGAAPAALPLFSDGGALSEQWLLLIVAGSVSGIVLVLLLRSGHRVGTRLRVLRAEHLALVDLIAAEPDSRDETLRVLAHPMPTAYCIPGRRSRVVLSEGALQQLKTAELDAVLAHERAHLEARHDLLLEFFTVVHEAVPAPIRVPAALDEVRLLIEVLADRVAIREAGQVHTARALFAIASGRAPSEAMSGGAAAGPRLQLMAAEHPTPVMTPFAYAFALVSVLLPVGLVAWAFIL